MQEDLKSTLLAFGLKLLMTPQTVVAHPRAIVSMYSTAKRSCRTCSLGLSGLHIHFSGIRMESRTDTHESPQTRTELFQRKSGENHVASMLFGDV